MAVAGARELLEIEASPETFFDVVCDVESYPEFLTGMRGARVLSRDGTESVAEYRVHFFRDYRYTLALTYEPGVALRWRQVEGPFQSLTGSWTLDARTERGIRVVYRIEMDIAFFLPSFLTQLVLEHSFPLMLREFRDRIENEERRRRRRQAGT